MAAMLLPFVASAAVFVVPYMPTWHNPPRFANSRAAPAVLSVDFDINAAVTRLNAAVAREDYAAAKTIKGEIDAALKTSATSEDSDEQGALTWAGAPAWLCSRLEDLEFRYPTPVQAAALRWNANVERSSSDNDDGDGRIGTEPHGEETLPAEVPPEPNMEPMVKAMEVIVPDGLTAGDILGVQTEDEQEFSVMVPDGCGPGDRLLIDLPSSASGSPPSPPPIQRDAVISAPTGSGKTLGFTVPMLCSVSTELERRSVETASALAELVDTPAGSHLSPTATINILAPALILSAATPADADAASRSAAQSEAAAASTVRARGPPLGLIITPTASLAEQAARQAYALVGGDDARQSRSSVPRVSTSPARYAGPKAVRVAALLTAEDGANAVDAVAEGEGVLCDSELLVLSSDALAAIGGSLDTSALRMVCVDEADAPGCADALSCATLAMLPPTARRMLIGATVGKSVARSVEDGWLTRPMLIDGRGTLHQWTADDLAQAICSPGLTHRFAVAPESGDANAVKLQLLALARLLRKDLREWQQLGAAAVPTPGEAFARARGISTNLPGQVEAVEAAEAAIDALRRPRAVVFTKDEGEALRVGAALRNALWGEQAVVVRAGAGAAESTKAFQSMRGTGDAGGFDGIITSQSASVLVVPMSEGRGLDFPEVTHVYLLSLGLSPADTNEYAHMAGRAGRVGQSGRGVVTSVISADAEWVRVFTDLNAIVQGSLGRSLEAVAVPATSEEEVDVRRALDDLVLLTNDSEAVDETVDEAVDETPETATGGSGRG